MKQQDLLFVLHLVTKIMIQYKSYGRDCYKILHTDGQDSIYKVMLFLSKIICKQNKWTISE